MSQGPITCRAGIGLKRRLTYGNRRQGIGEIEGYRERERDRNREREREKKKREREREGRVEQSRVEWRGAE